MSEAPHTTPKRPTYRPLLGLAVASFLGLLAIAGVQSYRSLDAARDQERRLEAEIEAAELRVEALRGRLELLENDPITLERLAREGLGMVRPEDVVIVLPAAGDPAADDPAAGDPAADGAGAGAGAASPARAPSRVD